MKLEDIEQRLIHMQECGSDILTVCHIQREQKDHLGILSPPRNQHSGWVQVICHIVWFISKSIDSRSHASILGHSLRLSLQNT